MKHHILLTSFLCSLCILSCTKTSKSEAETTVGEYKMPETIPLQFTDPEPFEWESITSDTLTIPVTYSLNVDALPSKPFALNEFKPLKTPMKEYDLDWDNFPTETLKYDSVAFTATKAPIKKPTITKMKPLGIMDGTNANLLQLATNEGLVNNDITSFLETEDGAIWIGTSTSSVMRYDGENIFSYDYSGVYKMTVDKQGKLWMMQPGTDLITVLDFKNDLAYSITTDNDFAPLNILCDHTGTLFITSGGDGLFTMDSEMTGLQKLTVKGRSRPFSFFEDGNDNLWLGFRNGLAVLDKERKEFKTISEIANYELNSIVIDIKEDQTGAIWLSLPFPAATNNLTSPILLRLSIKEDTAKVLDIENGYTIVGGQMVEDTHGNLWILGNTEAYILNENRRASKTIALNSALRGNRRLTRPLKRKDGSLWIATTDKGVVIANDFTLTTVYFDAATGLINDEVWDIEENSRGEIWLGTRAGVNIVDLKNNTITELSHELLHSNPNSTISFIKEISKDIYLIDGIIGFSILDRQKNTLTKYMNYHNNSIRPFGIAAVNEHTFMSYTRQGLFIYDIESNSLKKLISKTDPDILKATIGSVMVYDKEVLWIPIRNGLAKVDVKANTVSYLREEQGLCDNDANVVLLSKEGELWVATLNGMAILNFEENTLTNLKKENGLGQTEFYDLIEKDDIIYGASVNGLIPIEKAKSKTTNKGYYTFNGGFGFKRNDYLQGSPTFLKNGQFWSGVANPSSQFKLLVLDAAPKPDTTISSVFITNMFVMDEDPGFKEKSTIDSLHALGSSYATIYELKWDSVSYPYAIPKGLELPYNQNSLSFSYGSGDVFNRAQLTYRFILEGSDEDWTYAATETKTKNYYNLKPGQYSFKVSSRGFNREWSAPDIFTFNIAPPWWQTWWAYLLFGLLFVSTIWSVVSYRSRWLKKENRVLEERVSHRTEQLKNKIDELKATQSQLIQSEKMASLGELTAGIAHEIQNPLNFVNNFSEVNKELLEEMKEEIEKGNYDEVKALAKDVTDNEDKIIFHGRRADGIVKGMLQHSRSSSGLKELTDINVLADEYLRLAYHGLRAKDKSFNATLHTNFDDTIGKINVVPQDIGRVILNLITNAFYVVKEKKEQNPKDFEPTVSVSTKKKGNMVLISVTDNGNGIPKEVLDKIFQPFFTTKPSGKGTGLGLSLSYDIVKVHHGELNVETKKGGGTTFVISLPIGEDLV
ncbi:MAG: ATP-binding protein [Maribacter arcticus]|uniref:ATP-binding protein n=1 Tax=Maribacter arcticus TaxID=561365 RepID=UPI003002D6CA